LADSSVREFLSSVAARAPTPGGGSAAAAAAALGAALGVMVARFSSGQACARAAEALERALAELTGLIDADAEAYGGVDAAMKLARGTADQKKRRAEALQSALAAAAEVPLRTMEAALAAMGELPALGREGNANLSSDLGAAAQLLSAGLQAASLNVGVNAAAIRDAALKARLTGRVSEIVKEAAGRVQETLAAIRGPRRPAE
jgi:formiminotetrahydrofolate cyclodeaminase